MKSTLMSAAVGTAMLLAGCTVRSLNPLYTEGDVIFEPALLGTWSDGNSKETWTLLKSGEKEYELVWQSLVEKADRTFLEARLVRLKGDLFLDLSPKEVDDCFAIRAHVFVRVWPGETSLRFAALDPDWLRDVLEQGTEKIAHVRVAESSGSRESIVLRATTRELQEFLARHADDENAFPPADFRKVK